MNKAQRWFIEWSLGTALLLASVVWAVVLVWGIEAPDLVDSHPIHRLSEGVLALDRAVLVEAAKLMGALLWIWLCVFVRLGRKKEPMHRQPPGD